MLLSFSASRGPVFRLYFLNGQIDQDKTLAQGGFSMRPYFSQRSLITKNKNFRVLPLAPSVMRHGAISCHFVYGHSGRGQRSSLVRCAGPMNGSRIAVHATAHYEPTTKDPEILIFCCKSMLRKIRPYS